MKVELHAAAKVKSDKDIGDFMSEVDLRIDLWQKLDNNNKTTLLLKDPLLKLAYDTYKQLKDADDLAGFEDYNLIYDNTSGIDTGAEGGDNDVLAPSGDGYVDRASGDYNLATGADLYSTGVILNWDE